MITCRAVPIQSVVCAHMPLLIATGACTVGRTHVDIGSLLFTKQPTLCFYCYCFASVAVAVDSDHMTASSSASWSRFSPPSNFVNGHVSTMWFMVCCWPQSQEGDWARPHLCKLSRHWPWPVRKRFIRDHVWQERSAFTKQQFTRSHCWVAETCRSVIHGTTY